MRFKEHLTGIDGNRRSPTSAEAIITDISKLLHHSGKDELNWTHLTERKNISTYLEMIKKMGVGPDGQLTKLERLCDALSYLRYYQPSLKSKIEEMEVHIQRWKQVLRK